jgi:hypothetical protein
MYDPHPRGCPESKNAAWILLTPSWPSQENEDYWSILRWLRFKGAKVLKGPYGEDIFGDG